MSTNIDAFINQIINDAKQKVEADIKIVNAKAKKDFVDKAREVILLYYTNYDPDVYERTYNLRDHVLNKSVNAWVQFNPRYMSNYTHNNDFVKESVVDNFLDGIHGNVSVQIDSPTPAELMDDFQINYKKKILDGYFRNLGYSVKK